MFYLELTQIKNMPCHLCYHALVRQDKIVRPSLLVQENYKRVTANVFHWTRGKCLTLPQRFG